MERAQEFVLRYSSALETDPGDREESAITKGVHLQPLNCIERDFATEHVVPLQQLMQEDAVEKSTQADAKNNPGRFHGEKLLLRY
jgi:hypothetical protein